MGIFLTQDELESQILTINSNEVKSPSIIKKMQIIKVVKKGKVQTICVPDDLKYGLFTEANTGLIGPFLSVQKKIR